ncbi:MAG: recombination regulator RecX [Vibrio sp.]
MSSALSACRHNALQLLSRRDHGQYELQQKLALKGHPTDVIDLVINDCLALGYLDDARYAASQVRQTMSKGYGERHVRQQLKQKRIESAMIDQVLAEQQVDWFAQAKWVAHKKFPLGGSVERQQYAKQVRYLQYRGFDFEQIRYALQSNEGDE